MSPVRVRVRVRVRRACVRGRRARLCVRVRECVSVSWCERGECALASVRVCVRVGVGISPDEHVHSQNQ